MLLNKSKYSNVKFENSYSNVPIQNLIELTNISSNVKNNTDVLESLYKLKFIAEDDLIKLHEKINIEKWLNMYHLLRKACINDNNAYCLSQNGLNLIKNYTTLFLHSYSLDYYQNNINSYTISYVNQLLKSSHYYTLHRDEIIDFINNFKIIQYPLVFDMVYETKDEVLLFKYINNISKDESITSLCDFIREYCKFICSGELIYCPFGSSKKPKLVFTLDSEEIIEHLHPMLPYISLDSPVECFYISDEFKLIKIEC